MADSLLDPRGYLQQRVALFTGVAGAFFGGLLAIDLANPSRGELAFSSTRFARLGTVVVCAAVWAITRRGRRSAWQSRALELFAVGTALVVYATLPLHPPIPGAGGLISLFTPLMMAAVVPLRSAIVPSPVWLSVAIGVVWGLVMTVAGVVGFERITIDLPNGMFRNPRGIPIAMGFMALLTVPFVAGVTSKVVYGLQTRVREAMELGQYTLERKVGEGGMGVVYRARHRMLRRPTAVKLLPKEKAGENAIARFEQEVQQTSRLTHPNTVAIFDYGRTQDGLFYYAMEYLEGLSLQTLVETTGPVPADRVAHVLVQVADALTEAHETGLVHRDIKPDNVFLCERGGMPDVVKVLDFGLVKDVAAPTDTQLSAVNTVLGTPLYIAPEAVSAPEHVDGRADLYALGAVAYFLLSGEPVFRGRMVEVFGHHLHTTPRPLRELVDGVDPDLEAAVLQLLAKDPADRFPTARALARDLRASGLGRSWTSDRATAWWDAHRAAIAQRREDGEETPSDLTVAPA